MIEISLTVLALAGVLGLCFCVWRMCLLVDGTVANMREMLSELSLCLMSKGAIEASQAQRIASPPKPQPRRERIVIPSDPIDEDPDVDEVAAQAALTRLTGGL